VGYNGLHVRYAVVKKAKTLLWMYRQRVFRT